jgi:hypothetical protein
MHRERERYRYIANIEIQRNIIPDRQPGTYTYRKTDTQMEKEETSSTKHELDGHILRRIPNSVLYSEHVARSLLPTARANK